MITGQQIADTTLEAYECKGGYIWGQMGAEWTAAKQRNLEKKYKADPKGMSDYKLSAQYGSQWIGHRVWDCAGLCRWAAKQHGLEIHAGSNLIWQCDLSKKGALTKNMQLPVGALVFTGETYDKHPHIGTYTGDGKVTEANGAIKGVIQSGLFDGKWKWWGLEKGVTYEFIPNEEPAQQQPATKPTTKPDPAPAEDEDYPTIKRGSKGKWVQLAQVKLISQEYSCGPQGADGDFGKNTEAAVKLFQQEHDGPDGKALKVDGIIGPATWWALDHAPERITYTVTIKNLTADKADKLLKEYNGATKTPAN